MRASVDPDRLLVKVIDEGPALHATVDRELRADHRVGLRIVDDIVSRWGLQRERRMSDSNTSAAACA
jgi:hypothetical protein